MLSFKNTLIGGNFNIHIYDTDDPDTQILNDTMEALGFQQYVTFPTHQAGNTLDLMFTEITSKLDIKIFKDRYISDHWAIIAELKIRIQHTISTTVTFRNLRQVNPGVFGITRFRNITNWENPTGASNTYEKELMRVLDQLAPEKTKLLIKKEKKVWYDEEVADMKRALGRRK